MSKAARAAFRFLQWIFAVTIMSHLMNTYARLPVAFTHGQGAKVFDESGRSYLDALAGIADESQVSQ